MKGGRKIDDFVSLTDLAPTFLEAAGLPVPGQMTGRSLMPQLRSEGTGRTDPQRDHVLTGMKRRDGKTTKTAKAYAMTNHKEYFAETTEAFFGTNDFYPYNREDLKKHDPRMCELLRKKWGLPIRVN